MDHLPQCAFLAAAFVGTIVYSALHPEAELQQEAWATTRSVISRPFWGTTTSHRALPLAPAQHQRSSVTLLPRAPVSSTPQASTASSNLAVAPLAAYVVSVILAAVLGDRLTRVPIALASNSGRAESPAMRDLRRQLDSYLGKLDDAKARAARSKEELLGAIRNKRDSARQQMDAARAQVENLKMQLQDAQEDMVPKLRAELDRAKSSMEAARTHLRAASAEMVDALGDDCRLPKQAKVGWRLQNAIGIFGLAIQLWLSIVASSKGFSAARNLTSTTVSGGLLTLIFTVLAIGASWASVAWCFASHRLGKELRGDGPGEAPSKSEILRHLWAGLTLNAYGLLAGMAALQANAGLVYLEGVTTGIAAGTPSPSLTKGITAFEVFAQLAQSKVLLSLSIGLLLAVVTLRAASQPEPTKYSAMA